MKHVGRVRVPKDLADEELSATSPRSPRANEGPTIKKIVPRESMMPDNTVDESTMEMSIREIKEIQKPTMISTLNKR